MGPIEIADGIHRVGVNDRLSAKKAQPEVGVVYGSLYGNRTAMMEAVCAGVREGVCPTATT